MGLEYSTVLVELDALIDTRVSVLNTLMNDETLVSALEKYHHRLVDEFPGVSFEDYQSLYSKRNSTVFNDCVMTKIGHLLHEFSVKTIQLQSSSPIHKKPKILLNVYPYELTENEKIALVRYVVNITGGLADVSIINKSYVELTPEYLSANVDIIILYEYYKWLELNSIDEKIKKNPIPHVTLIGPAIYFKPVLKYDPNIFKTIENITGPFIQLSLLPIADFSFIL